MSRSRMPLMWGRIWSCFNAKGLTAHQAKRLLDRVGTLIQLRERIASKTVRGPADARPYSGREATHLAKKGQGLTLKRRSRVSRSRRAPVGR